ncbi:hypothetical protein IWX90DRAFT_488456 [Phyllosticta citrichinensis]|uniref:Uncharacterized protein n=1 Tax=Phyllosticta citrichinensis TaxID=1130410 RepID=A0ABR1XPL0_9PEZI
MTSILLYRHSYTHPGHGTISTIHPNELSSLLAAAGPRTVHTTLALPRGASTVAVRQLDLLMPDERARWADLPNMQNVVATVRIPWRLRVGRSWDVLHVVSERAPAE